MNRDFVRRRWISMVTLATVLLQTSPIYAAAPLQKVLFVFSGFNERTSFLFVDKDRHFFEEQGLDVQIVQARSGPVASSEAFAVTSSRC